MKLCKSNGAFSRRVYDEAAQAGVPWEESGRTNKSRTETAYPETEPWFRLSFESWFVFFYLTDSDNSLIF